MNKQQHRRTNDKIMDNKFNRKEIEYDVYNQPIQVELKFKERYSDLYNPELGYSIVELFKIIEDLEQRNYLKQYLEKNRKKIPKSKMKNLFIFIYDNVDKTYYSIVQIFMAVCEYYNCSYGNFYNELPLVYKEKIIKEVSAEYNFDSDKANLPPNFF